VLDLTEGDGQSSLDTLRIQGKDPVDADEWVTHLKNQFAPNENGITFLDYLEDGGDNNNPRLTKVFDDTLVDSSGRVLPRLQVSDATPEQEALVNEGYQMIANLPASNSPEQDFIAVESIFKDNKIGRWKQAGIESAVESGLLDQEIPSSSMSDLAREDSDYLESGVQEAITDTSFFEKVSYGMSASRTDFQYVDAMITAITAGEYKYHGGIDGEEPELIYLDGNAMYGEGYSEASYSERKAMILATWDAETETKFKDIIEEADKDDWEVTLGNVIGSLITPTTLFVAPKVITGIYQAGKWARRAAMTTAAGAGWGAQYSIIEQYATENTLNARTFLADTLMSAGFTLGLYSAGTSLLGMGGLLGGKVVASFRARRATKQEQASQAAVVRSTAKVSDMDTKTARSLFRDIERRIVESWGEHQSVALSKGVDSKEFQGLADEAASADRVTGIIQAEFPEVFSHTGEFQRKTGWELPRITQDAAKRADSWWNDGVSNWKNNVRSISGFADYAIGNLDTTIRNISERLFGDWRRVDIASNIRLASYTKIMKNFDDSLETVSPAVSERIWWELFRENWDAVGVMAPNAKIREAGTLLNKMLDQIGDDLIKQKVIKTKHGFKETPTSLGKKVATYFPRVVRDIDAWRMSLGREPRAEVDAIIEASGKDKGRPLTKHEQRVMLGEMSPEYAAEFPINIAKRRFFSRFAPPAEQAAHYYHPKAALAMYIRDSTQAISTREFFNMDTAPKNILVKGTQLLDINVAVAHKLDDPTQRTGHATGEGRDKFNEQYTAAEEEVLSKILKARFDPAATHQSEFLRGLQDMMYMTLLGQPTAALTQFADSPGIGGFVVGQKHILKSAWQLARIKLSSSKKKTFDHELDGGITDAIHELQSSKEQNMRIRAAASKAMELSQFKRVDRIGKSIVSNAALLKAMEQIESPKGLSDLYNKYSTTFGDEWVVELVGDLHKLKEIPVGERSKGMTYGLLEYTMMELADAQPITKGQVPMWRLQHPRASLPLALLSYQLKVMDVARTRILYQLGKGNVRLAAKEATRFTAYVGGSAAGIGFAKDWLAGKDISGDEMMHRLAWGTAEQFMMDEHTWNMISTWEDPQLWATPITHAASVDVLSDLLFMVSAGFMYMGKYDENRREQRKRENKWDKASNAVLQRIPVGGKLIFGYNPISRNKDYNESRRKERRLDNRGN
jgi:hypothetical protein